MDLQYSGERRGAAADGAHVERKYTAGRLVELADGIRHTSPGKAAPAVGKAVEPRHEEHACINERETRMPSHPRPAAAGLALMGPRETRTRQDDDVVCGRIVRDDGSSRDDRAEYVHRQIPAELDDLFSSKHRLGSHQNTESSGRPSP